MYEFDLNTDIDIQMFTLSGATELALTFKKGS